MHEICRTARGASWFEGSHVNLFDMILMSVWSGKCKQKYTRRVCGMAEKTSSDWYSFNREVCILSDDLCVKLDDCAKIMEIDESVLWKMKYRRGRLVN